MKIVLLILLMGNIGFANTSNLAQVIVEKKEKQSDEGEVFYLSPESPLNQDSLDLSQPLFIGETSLSFSLRNPLDGTSGGNACSSCSH